MREVSSRSEWAAAFTAVRTAADLSIRELSRRTDVPSATLGGWFSGRNLPQAGQLPALVAVLAECGLTDADVAEWVATVRRLRTATAAPVVVPPRPASPYPGLASFTADDSALFFGRAAETAEILTRLEHLRADPGPSHGMLAVIGPSGSGKSSLLGAGLAAALARRTDDDDAWTCAIMTPGSDPQVALAGALEGFGRGTGVLVVDQFEEIFTAVDDPAERGRFLAALTALTEPPVGALVVLGLRADFFAAAVGEAALVPVLQHAQFLLGPLGPDALRQVVTGPAAAVGVEVEDALAEIVLADAAPRGATGEAHDAGALPLLSHALLSAWNRGSGLTLTTADYLDAGGVDGAVQRTAESAWNELDETGRGVARSLFLRLVNLGDSHAEAVALTRRRVTGTELVALQDDTAQGDGGTAVRTVVDAFVVRRLLTAGASSIEISHEALLSAWPRLREWIDSDRAALRLHRSLTEAANTWDHAGRDETLLPRGGRLAALTELVATPSARTDLNQLERDYVAAGVAVARAVRDAARRRTSRLRRLLASVAVLAVIAAALAVYSGHARSDADRAERSAAGARDLALSRQIAGQSRQLRDSDPALAQQLALAAYRTAPSDEARGALIDQSSQPSITRVLGAQGPTPLASSTDGTLLAVGHADTGAVHLLRRGTGVPRLLAVIPSPDPAPHQLFAMDFSTDAGLLAVGGEPGRVRLWDVSDPAHPQAAGSVATGFTGDVQSVDLSPDGRLLAVAGTGSPSVRVWSLADRAAPAAEPVPRAPSAVKVMSVRFAPSGRTMAAVGADGVLRTWGVTGSRPDRPRQATFPGTAFVSLCWRGDAAVVVGSDTGTVVPVAVGTLRATHAPVTVTDGDVNGLQPRPGAADVLVASSDGTVAQWSTTDWTMQSSLGNPGPVTGIAYSPDGSTILSTAADGTLRSYAASAGLPADGPVYNLAFSAGGARLAVASGGAGPGLRIWDVRAADRPRRVSPLIGTPAGVAPSSGTVGLRADGDLVATGTPTGQLVVWDVSTPARPRLLGGAYQALAAGSLAESVTWFPGAGRTLAVGGDDSTVRLLDVRDPARPRPLARVTTGGLVLNTAVSPDGRLLAAASADGHAYVWQVADPARPRLLGRLGGFKSYVYAVGFSPTGNRLAVGSADHTVRLWDLHGNGSPTPAGRPLIGPSDYVYALAFSPDGRRLVVGSNDRTVRVFDVGARPDRVPAETLDAVGENVFAVAFSPDGRRILGAGRSTSVARWDVDVAGYSRQLCGAVGDPITRDEWSLHVPGAPYDPPCR